jgi:magnesium transporter
MTSPALEIDYEEILDNILYLLENDQTQFVRNILADLHPADIADLIERLDSKYRRTVFSLLLPEVASDVLTELEDALKEDILKELDSSRIAALVSEMDSDDATDVVLELPEEKVSEVLAQVEEESSEEIQELLHYAEDTAGGIMAKEFVAVNQNCSVEEAIDELRRKREEVEEIYQCYVVDDAAKLVGFVPLKELILAKPRSIIKDIMDTDVFAIEREMDQEEVAHIFDKYDLVSAAVVNKDYQMIGRITIDDIVDVINEETDEDMARIAGIGEEEILEESVSKIVKARLPWLVVSFLGQLISAYIMSRFEASIEKILVSAFFIPLVMAMGGSVGQQTGVIVVRGLATGEINPNDLRRRLLRETKAAIVNASAIALLTLAAVVTMIGTQHSNFGMVLACSLVVVVLNASLFGALIPFGFKKFDIDPAIASGPFVATFNDVVGLLIYFSLLAISMYFGII